MPHCGNCKIQGHTRTHCPQIVTDSYYFDKVFPPYAPNSYYYGSVPRTLRSKPEYRNGTWLKNALQYNSSIPYSESQITELLNIWRTQELYRINPSGSRRLFKYEDLSDNFKSTYMKGRQAGYMTQVCILVDTIRLDVNLRQSILINNNQHTRKLYDTYLCNMFDEYHSPFQSLFKKKGWWNSMSMKNNLKNMLNIPNIILNNEFDVLKENINILKKLLNYFWDKIPENHLVHKLGLHDFHRIQALVRYFMVNTEVRDPNTQRTLRWNSIDTNNALLSTIINDIPISISSKNTYYKAWNPSPGNSYGTYANGLNSDVILLHEQTIERFLDKMRTLRPNLTFIYRDYLTVHQERIQYQQERQLLRQQREQERQRLREQQRIRVIEEEENRKKSLADKKSYNPNLIIETENCCICFDELKKNNKVILPCGHQNCLQCFIKLNLRKSSNTHRCPMCRDDYTIVGNIMVNKSINI